MTQANKTKMMTMMMILYQSISQSGIFKVA